MQVKPFMSLFYFFSGDKPFGDNSGLRLFGSRMSIAYTHIKNVNGLYPHRQCQWPIPTKRMSMAYTDMSYFHFPEYLLCSSQAKVCLLSGNVTIPCTLSLLFVLVLLVKQQKRSKKLLLQINFFLLETWSDASYLRYFIICPFLFQAQP